MVEAELCVGNPIACRELVVMPPTAEGLLISDQDQ